MESTSLSPQMAVLQVEESYFHYLPDELVCTIFSYFPIVQIYPILSQVCSHFRRRLLQGCMWTNIDGFALAGMASRLTADAVFHMISFLNSNALDSHVKTLDIPRCKFALPCPTTALFLPLFSNLRCLSIRNATMGGLSSWLSELSDPANQCITWPSMKFLNLCNTNMSNSQFFKCVTLPNVECMVLSGVSVSNCDDMLGFILRSNRYLRNLDISRTRLDEQSLGFIVQSSPNLDYLVATELKWRPLEDSIQAAYAHLKIRTQLLPHRKDNLARRISDVACLYDVDGNGCSLVADAIYVGIKCDVIKYLIQSLDIDVNKCDYLPPPWVVPYPTKFIESFELLRAPLPFHQSVLLNKFDISNMLLGFGADMYGKTPAGLTPLMNILSSTIIDSQSRDHAITYLLEQAVIVDFGSLLSAVQKSVTESVVLAMLGHMEEFSQQSRQTKLDKLLQEATIRGRTQLVTRLVKLGANVASLINDRENCLVAAIKSRNFSLVETIIDTGPVQLANALTAKDYCGWTALTFAVALIPTADLARIAMKMVKAGARIEDVVNAAGELPAVSYAMDRLKDPMGGIGGEAEEFEGQLYLPPESERGNIIRQLILDSKVDITSLPSTQSTRRLPETMSESA